MTWRRKPSHLLVQEFPVVSVHFLRPHFCQLRLIEKHSKAAAVSLTAVEQTSGSLIGDANPVFNDALAINSKR